MAHESPPPRKRDRAVRVEVGAPGAIEGAHRVVGEVRDISLHGLFLVCPRRLPPGREITVRFSLPMDGGEVGRVEARAEVRHRGAGAGVGLRFLRLPYESATIIQRYLSSRTGRGEA